MNKKQHNTFTSTEQPIVQYGFRTGSEWQTRCTNDVFPTPVNRYTRGVQ